MPLSRPSTHPPSTGIKQNIIRLDIPMGYAQVVAESNCYHQLLKNRGGTGLGEAVARGEAIVLQATVYHLLPASASHRNKSGFASMTDLSEKETIKIGLENLKLSFSSTSGQLKRIFNSKTEALVKGMERSGQSEGDTDYSDAIATQVRWLAMEVNDVRDVLSQIGFDLDELQSMVSGLGKMGASLHRSVRGQAIGKEPPYLMVFKSATRWEVKLDLEWELF